LPETPERRQQELLLHIALGVSLITTKGYGAPEVEQTYRHAQHLCAYLDDPLQLFAVLRGLWLYYIVRAELQTAHALGEQLLTLAQQVHESAMLVTAYRDLGMTLFFLGAAVSAHTYLTQGLALYDPQHHHAAAFVYGEDVGVACSANDAVPLWLLGYPDQSLARINEAVTFAQQTEYPFSLSFALTNAALVHHCRREDRAAQACADTVISLTTAQSFPYWMACGAILRGWALAQQGTAKEGIEQLSQGLKAYGATGAEIFRPYWLALLAEAHGIMGQPEKGLMALTEALTLTDRTGERWYEAELYRLRGALLLQQSADNQADAESCFHHALDIARSQQAKSFELRSATSLARLWQQQGKRQDAHDLLAPVYNWFTEGFDTADLIDAQALLDELSEGSP
jgi:predicted ATPase